MKESVEIIKKITAAGGVAVLAGGCVRDMILGNIPNDYDIATNFTPDQIIDLFSADENINVVLVGKQFGVITLFFHKEQKIYEIATFRRDSNTSDGRRPDSVEFSSIEEDALRRDFTINGMFYDPVDEKFIDFIGGMDDLENHTIRFIGNAQERIDEDYLRIIRAIRFSIKFDFTLTPGAEIAIRNNLHQLKNVSIERIHDELNKIFLSACKLGKLSKAIEILDEYKILDMFIPEVSAMKGVEQPAEFHPEGDVFVHVLKVLDNLPNDSSIELIWGTLLHDIGKPPTMTVTDRIRFNNHDMVGEKMARKRLTELKFSNDQIDHICCLIHHHMNFRFVQEMKDSTLKRLMRVHRFDEHLLLHRADCLGSFGGLDNFHFASQKFEDWQEEDPTQVTDGFKAFINGNDLISWGFKPGPSFKVVLQIIEDKQLDGEITSKEEAEILARKIMENRDELSVL